MPARPTPEELRATARRRAAARARRAEARRQAIERQRAAEERAGQAAAGDGDQVLVLTRRTLSDERRSKAADVAVFAALAIGTLAAALIGWRKIRPRRGIP